MPTSAPEPLLQVSGLSAGYGKIVVLRDIALTIGAGEAVALLGPNGAGKTTLLRAVSGLLPWSGRVQFAGRDLAGLSRWLDRLDRASLIEARSRSVWAGAAEGADTSVDYFGSTRSTSPCGLGMTCTEMSSPTRRAAAAPASVAAFTAPTSPRISTVT